MKFSAFLRYSIVIFLSFALLPLTSPSAFAQIKTASPSSYPVANTNSDVPNNLHNWTQNAMIEVMSSLTCQLAGIDPISPKQPCLGADQKTGKIGFLPSSQTGGAIGLMGTMVSSLYTPPLHTADYFQSLAANFGINKKAYAETGTGFDSLKPLMSIWITFRNIVYLILVIVFVLIGLAIMLRVKIDPRTVMTIQNQIPKIIVGILAVTFSFAIAGFLIDIMWVLIYLIYGLVSGASKDIATSVMNLNPILLQGQSPLIQFGNLNDLAAPVAGGARDVIKSALGITNNISNYIPIFSVTSFKTIADMVQTGNFNFDAIMKLAQNPFSFMTDQPMDYIINLSSNVAAITTFVKVMAWADPSILGIKLGWVANAIPATVVSMIAYEAAEMFLRDGLPWIIVYIIITIALLTALFKLWFTLLMAYIQILVDVALAPFWIIGGIVPGSPISLSGWIKDLSANLLAFPATIFMLLLGRVFMNAFSATKNPFAPPLIGDLGKPEMLSPLIGIGIIMMTPNVINMIKAAIKAPKTDMGGAIKGLTAGAGLPIKSIQSGAGLYGAATFDISGERKAAGRGGRIFQRLFH